MIRKLLRGRGQGPGGPRSIEARLARHKANGAAPPREAHSASVRRRAADEGRDAFNWTDGREGTDGTDKAHGPEPDPAHHAAVAELFAASDQKRLHLELYAGVREALAQEIDLDDIGPEGPILAPEIAAAHAVEVMARALSPEAVSAVTAHFASPLAKRIEAAEAAMTALDPMERETRQAGAAARLATEAGPALADCEAIVEATRVDDMIANTHKSQMIAEAFAASAAETGEVGLTDGQLEMMEIMAGEFQALVADGNRGAVALFMEGISEDDRAAYIAFLETPEAAAFFSASDEALKRVLVRETAKLGAMLAAGRGLAKR